MKTTRKLQIGVAALALAAAAAPPAFAEDLGDSTFSRASCDFSVPADVPAQCTLVVQNSAGGAAPGGPISWTVTTGTLPDGPTCVLTPIGGSSSSCSVRWLLPQPTPANLSGRITGVFSQRAGLAASSGATFATFQAAAAPLGISCVAQPTGTVSCRARIDGPYVFPGDVAWSATGGSFPSGDRCTLAPVPGTAFSSECRVDYVGNSDVAVTIRAKYLGTWAFRPAEAELLTSPNPAPAAGGSTTPPPASSQGGTSCGTTGQVAQERRRLVSHADPVRIICPPQVTKEQKEDAEDNRRDATNRRLYFSALSATSAMVAAGAAPVPGGQGVSAVFAFFAGLYGLTAVAYDYQAEQWARVVSDPPDPGFRTIAAPLVTKPKALRITGLSKKDAAKVRAYAAAQLRLAALSSCVSVSIDRGMGAINAGESAFASRQYAAGSDCAAEAATLAARMPALVKPVAALVQGSKSEAGRVLRAGKPGKAAIRARIASQYAALGKAIAIPPARLAALKAAATKAADGRPVAPPGASVLTKAAAVTAADAPLLRQVSAALGQAAGR